MIEQRFFCHPVVALGMIRRHASLVAEQHRDPAPLHFQRREELIAAFGRRAPGQDQGLRAVAQRLGDLRRRRLRNLFGRREDDELGHLELLHQLRRRRQRAVVDLVVSPGRE